MDLLILRKTFGPNAKNWLGVGLAVCLLFVLNGCGKEKTDKSRGTTQSISPRVEGLLPNRLMSSHPVTDETRKTYQWYCSQCHGTEGKGNGINSKYVTVPPLDHTKPDYLETRSDEELFNAIRLGGLQVGRAPCMPAWGHTLEEKMIWSLVQYIRELCHCEAL